MTLLNGWHTCVGPRVQLVPSPGVCWSFHHGHSCFLFYGSTVLISAIWPSLPTGSSQPALALHRVPANLAPWLLLSGRLSPSLHLVWFAQVPDSSAISIFRRSLFIPIRSNWCSTSILTSRVDGSNRSAAQGPRVSCGLSLSTPGAHKKASITNFGSLLKRSSVQAQDETYNRVRMTPGVTGRAGISVFGQCSVAPFVSYNCVSSVSPLGFFLSSLSYMSTLCLSFRVPAPFVSSSICTTPR